MFIPRQSWKTEREPEKLDRALERLSAKFTMKSYPYAGSLSTAHTLLWYDHFGPSAFKQNGRRENIDERESVSPDEAYEVLDREEEIWRRLLFNKRTVYRQAYAAEASRMPLWKPF